MMERHEYIEQLIERFLDGATSLSEEKELYAFFAGEEVPEHLEPYRELFAWFDGGLADEVSKTVAEQPAPRPKFRIRVWATVAVAAAAVAVILLMRPAAPAGEFDPFEGSYIVRNGVKITDPVVVRPEAEATLQKVDEEELKIAWKLYQAHKEEYAYAQNEWKRSREMLDFVHSFPEGEARTEILNILLDGE